jgi:hypothetical protein
MVFPVVFLIVPKEGFFRQTPRWLTNPKVSRATEILV